MEQLSSESIVKTYFPNAKIASTAWLKSLVDYQDKSFSTKLDYSGFSTTEEAWNEAAKECQANAKQIGVLKLYPNACLGTPIIVDSTVQRYYIAVDPSIKASVEDYIPSYRTPEEAWSSTFAAFTYYYSSKLDTLSLEDTLCALRALMGAGYTTYFDKVRVKYLCGRLRNYYNITDSEIGRLCDPVNYRVKTTVADNKTLLRKLLAESKYGSVNIKTTELVAANQLVQEGECCFDPNWSNEVCRYLVICKNLKPANQTTPSLPLKVNDELAPYSSYANWNYLQPLVQCGIMKLNLTSGRFFFTDTALEWNKCIRNERTYNTTTVISKKLSQNTVPAPSAAPASTLLSSDDFGDMLRWTKNLTINTESNLNYIKDLSKELEKLATKCEADLLSKKAFTDDKKALEQQLADLEIAHKKALETQEIMANNAVVARNLAEEKVSEMYKTLKKLDQEKQKLELEKTDLVAKAKFFEAEVDYNRSLWLYAVSKKDKYFEELQEAEITYNKVLNTPSFKLLITLMYRYCKNKVYSLAYYPTVCLNYWLHGKIPV